MEGEYIEVGAVGDIFCGIGSHEIIIVPAWKTKILGLFSLPCAATQFPGTTALAVDPSALARALL